MKHHPIQPPNTVRTLAVVLLAANALAAETGSLEEHLEPLRPFLGKTWRGEFKGAGPDKPTVDVSRWERALNGQAVRIVHSINDGVYGGESIVQWDKELGQVRYHYFTTAGFSTVGTLQCADGKITAVETVKGNANGITEVRSTYELRPDGVLLNKSEYLKGETAASAREVAYREDPKAEPKFR